MSEVFWAAFLAVFLAVLGGVLTDLGIRGVAWLLQRRSRTRDYGDLHKAIYTLADENENAARIIVNGLVASAHGKEEINPDSLIWEPWDALRVRYVELSPKDKEVYDLSVFFAKTRSFAELARERVRYRMDEPNDFGLKRTEDALRQSYKELSTQHGSLKKTYWHPDYKPAYFPFNPNDPPKKK